MNNEQNKSQIKYTEFDRHGFEKLTEKEIERISKLSIPELVELFKTGDTLQSYAAADQLTKGDRTKENFDMLLTLAGEIRGQAITEGLIKPIKMSSSDEDKLMVDKYLDFLESQLKKDKPSVPYEWAVRGIGQSINITSNMSGWKTIDLLSKIKDANEIDIPYANERATNILISCVDSNNFLIRREAIRWFGAIGANDPKKIDNMINILNDKLVKEQYINESEERKSEMTRAIIFSLDRINQKKNELERMR